MNLPFSLSQERALQINTIALGLLFLPLFGALIVQVVMGELPCPLCLLQRFGILAVAFGLILNLMYGAHPRHYGIALVSAFVGASVSARQILLHIVPVAGEPTGYGDAVLGMHLYTWAFVVFACSIVGIAVLLMFSKWDTPEAEVNEGKRRTMAKYEKIIIYLFLAIVTLNVVLAYLECGLGECPDDPQVYMMLQ